MKKGIDIYNYDRKFEATVRNMRASKITEQNKKLIEKFYNFCFANGIGKPRVIKYVRTLRQLAEWLKNINSFKQLNSAKFKVIHELEELLPAKIYQKEDEYLQKGYYKLTAVEKCIPIIFGILYVMIILISL